MRIWLARELTDAGYECLVIAPSLIPSRPGDHIKTDKRDATMLAKMHRAGELTTVWVPDASHEAVRDLVRAREAAMYWRNRARQALSSFCCGTAIATAAEARGPLRTGAGWRR